MSAIKSYRSSKTGMRRLHLPDKIITKTLKCVTIHDLSVFIYQCMQEKLPVAGFLYYFGLFA